MYTSHYSKVISAIMSAAVLAGLQSVMTATPVRAQTTCNLDPRAADAYGLWPQTGAANRETCPVPAGRKALARSRAALQDAHAEVGHTAAPGEVNEAAAHAQVSEAIEEQRPGAPHCMAAPGPPFRRGAWELGIDRATGHRCWRLAGTIKPHARIATRAKSAHVPKPAARSQRLTAATAGPIAAPAAVDAHRPGQPSEAPTGGVARPSKTQPVNPSQSPVSAADAVSKPGAVDRGELPLFDPRFARAADPGSIGTSAALVATATDDAKIFSGSMLEHVAALIPVRGRPAVFLIVFFSVLATISASYVLVIGCLKLLRPRRLQSAPAIGVTPRRYLAAMKAGSPDEHV